MKLCLTVPLLLVFAAPSLNAQAATTLSADTKAFVSVDAPVVALTHVKVVDGTGAAPANDQTVVIDNGKIAAVGPFASTKVPTGAKVMELRGSTVIPGLVGLHDHTFYTTSAMRRVPLPFSAPKLYLGSGVTTIRTTGSINPYTEVNVKAQIEKGEVPGPRMFITGPYITGPDLLVERVHVTTPEEARRVVAYWTEEGASWFKVYAGISHVALAAVIDEAHKRGAKVTGHLCSIGFREAVALGIDGLEHGFSTNSEWDPAKKPDDCPQTMRETLARLDVNSEPVQTTIRDIVSHHVPITSTLAVYEASLPNRPPLETRVLTAMIPEAREEYLTSRARAAESPGGATSVTIFKKSMEFERAFVKAGGLLAAGVDPTGNGGALPGFGDQRNYELLIEAGFTPVEAIQIMTSNGAKVLGQQDKVGTVAAGKLADLVVIQGDPVATPADIRKVTTVFKDGVGYDSQKLIDAVKSMVGQR
jgi:imidazolonepropionase-like amidohydrolase